MMKNEQNIRDQILALVEQLQQIRMAQPPAKEMRVPYAGRVFDDNELKAAVSASLDGWLTWGKHGELFERKIANYLGTRYALAVNSGSSANLVAFSTLTSPKLDRPIRPGDEIITTSASFPTTVNPIIQNQCIPVFVDIELKHYTPSIEAIQKAIGPRTRGIFIAHTLGVPFDLEGVMALAKQQDLYVIEDNCDALGSRFKGQLTGTFGDLSTLSLYPAHHMTMGEGGVVFTNNSMLYTVAKSFRDWGRDCWCESGKDNTCGKRFGWKLGGLPEGYDHKYVYSHIGYNLKPIDIQAAIGIEQLIKVPSFIEKRKTNWNFLRRELSLLEHELILPEALPHSDPSWFAFMMCTRPNSKLSRAQLVSFLESKGIQTRPLFAGNLLKHPAYKNIQHRIVGSLSNSDYVLEHGFFVGVYPGLGEEQLQYIVEQFKAAFNT